MLGLHHRLVQVERYIGEQKSKYCSSKIRCSVWVKKKKKERNKKGSSTTALHGKVKGKGSFLQEKLG